MGTVMGIAMGKATGTAMTAPPWKRVYPKKTRFTAPCQMPGFGMSITIVTNRMLPPMNTGMITGKDPPIGSLLNQRITRRFTTIATKGPIGPPFS